MFEIERARARAWRRLVRLPLLVAALTIAATTCHAQIVALGASSTAGYGVGASASFPSLVQAILRAKGKPMSVSNAGMSGDTTGGMLARLSSAVPQGTKIVILQIGGNDARKGIGASVAAANRARSAGSFTRAGYAPSKRTASFRPRCAPDYGSPTAYT